MLGCGLTTTSINCQLMDVHCDLGTWLDSGLRNTPRGDLTWSGIPRRVYTASAGGQPVAVVRRALYQATWIADMKGFVWDIRGTRGSTTTQALNIESANVRGFPTSAAARKAVEAAYNVLINTPSA